MDQNLTGLSEDQQNDCRAAMEKFIDRHGLSDWETIVHVQETAPGKYSLKVEVTPSPKSGLPTWPIQEIEIEDGAVDVAARVDTMLELVYRTSFLETNTQQRR